MDHLSSEESPFCDRKANHITVFETCCQNKAFGVEFVNVYRISSIMQAWKYASEVELFECYWLQLRQDK